MEQKKQFYFFENGKVKSSDEPLSVTFKLRYIEPLPTSITMSKEEAYERFGKEFVEEQLNKTNMENNLITNLHPETEDALKIFDQQKIIEAGNKNYELAKQIFNMENKSNTTVGLNEKIRAILDDNEYWFSNGDFKPDAASNAIERLIIQEKIDLLNQLWQRHMTNNKLLGENFSTYINELTTKLNQLK